MKIVIQTSPEGYTADISFDGKEEATLGELNAVVCSLEQIKCKIISKILLQEAISNCCPTQTTLPVEP